MITRKESRNECHAYDPNDEQYYVSLPAEPSRSRDVNNVRGKQRCYLRYFIQNVFHRQ